MSGTLEKLIRNKVDKDGPGAFRSVSLSNFLTKSGHRLDTAGLVRLADTLADADLRAHLPAISSALGDIARDADGGGAEFARLACRIAGRVGRDPVQGPLRDSLRDIGSDRPELAVSAARLLVESGSAHQAAFLLGGAWRGAPAECRGITETLLRSKKGEEVAVGVRSMHIAWKRHGVPDEAHLFAALSGVAMRPDGAAAAEVLGALVDIYPKAREVDPLIEYMARRHAVCRAALAARICHPSSPFDDATALHYLAICTEGAPGFQTMHNIHMAIAGLVKRRPADAVKIIVEHLFDKRFASAAMGHALQEIGHASPRRLTAAILDKVSAEQDPVRDLFLFSVINDIAGRADPNEILDVLFDALESGGATTRPALRMINAMVTHNCDTLHDNNLASRTLSRLVRYAQMHDIDTAWLQKANHNAYLKSAAVIRRILHPPPAVDARRVLENLDMFPALKKAFGLSWFKRAAEPSSAPHPLVIYLSTLSLEKIESLLDSPQDETFNERRNRKFRLDYEPRPFEILSFLDRALALLDGAGMGRNRYVRNMKNADQFTDTLSEIALVVPFVARKHPVVLEPSVGEKQLDAAIELGPQRVLVEVFNPRMWGPVDLLDGSREIPTDRAGKKIFDKVTEQLSAVGPCTNPIIVAINTTGSEITLDTVEDYVLGPLDYTVPFDTDADRAVGGGGGGAGRDAGKCMHNLDSQTDLISAVVCFVPTMSSDLSAAARGTIVENPHARVPLSPNARDELARALQCAPPDDGGRGGEPQ